MNDSAILVPGRNCWRLERASRLAFLVDGASYFPAFRETAKNAVRSIYLIAWDIDSRFELVREDPHDNLPTQLRDFLDRLASRRKRLHVHVLDWDFAMLYAPDREWLPQYRMDWTTGPRVHFHLDSQHPIGASHHQKLVVVDDRVAFVGGLDFTLGRWDSSAHRPGDPRRRDIGGEVPPPYHDIQLMVGGPVAAALGQLARQRWHHGTGQQLHAPRLPAGHDPWPAQVQPDLVDVEVGIARTAPQFAGREGVYEVERLLLDAIAAARRCIYIEDQYLTSTKIGDALAHRLAEPGGPEVVVTLPLHSDGWLSQHTMDVLRERLLRRLSDADQHDRLRVYYPDMPGLGDQCINVHAKLLIADDRLLRIGSANLNNRSMGLDTECDLAIEARGDARIASAIADLRNRLLAEHLDTTPEAVSAAVTAHGSLIRAVDGLRGSQRTLRTYLPHIPDELDEAVPDAEIADPGGPLEIEAVSRQLLAEDEAAPATRTVVLLASLLAVTLALAAAWRWTPLGDWLDADNTVLWLTGLQRDWTAPLVIATVYVAAGLVAFPVTLLIIATGAAFGAVMGFAYAMLGATVSALATFALGHLLGHRALRRLPHRWVSRASRRVARQGLLAIVTLRVVPVAPFSVINLVAGASHIRLRDFLIGTLLGMAPGALALTVFSGQLIHTLMAPEAIGITLLLVLVAAIAGGTWLLGRWLLRRGGTETSTSVEQ